MTDNPPPGEINDANGAAGKVEKKEMSEEEKRRKRKQSLEASVKLGLGHGKRKQRNIKAFYKAIWPVLEDTGWSLVSFTFEHTDRCAWH